MNFQVIKKIGAMVAIAAVSLGCLSCERSDAMQVSNYFPNHFQRDLAAAAERGDINSIKRALENGARVDFQGEAGMTALVWALINGSKSGYAYLLNVGANPNLRIGKSPLSSYGVTDGSSAVSLAAMHEDPEYLRLALSHGGDPNILNPVRGTTPIFDAISLADGRWGKPDTQKVSMLIAAGAKLDAQDSSGYTPLMIAALANRYDLVYSLLVAKADPTIQANNGDTLAQVIEAIRTDPASDMNVWREKVIDLLNKSEK